MLNIIFVRHGETDSNVKSTYCGWTDVGLNENGEAHARNAAEKLKDELICAIFTSTLKRAVNTAEIINVYHLLKLEAVEALKERNFGVWDDLTINEIKERFSSEYDQWCKDWRNYKMQDGENAIEAEQRVMHFIDEIKENYKDCSVVVVSHLGCIRTMLAHLLEMGAEQAWRFRVDNGKVSRVIINDEGYAYLTELNI